MTYLSPDEIVQDLLQNLNHETLAVVRDMPQEKLISLHFSLGMFIRNKYNLWDQLNPHVNNKDPMGDDHADQVSQMIIEHLWTQLTGKLVTAEKPVIVVNENDSLTVYIPTSPLKVQISTPK